MCLGAAFTARIGTVVFGLESPTDGGVDALEHWDRTRRAEGMPGYRLPRLRGGVGRAESAALFEEYARRAPEGWAKQWAVDVAALAGPEDER
jgi:tRNA(Arg) A34 adenosine deaminase TadA